MVTKREYLIEKGLAKPGRGRMSGAAHEEIKKAINKGIKFTDNTEVSGAGIGGETKPPRFDRPNGLYTFINPDGTTFKRLHTEACSRCFYSFQWCYCVSGTVQWAYLGQVDEYATLHEVPARPKVVEDDKPVRRRRAPRKAKAA